MRVKRGEIYIAADKSKCGHLVLDVVKYKEHDDIITQPFDINGKYGEDFSGGVPERVSHMCANHISKFKLTMVRYFRCDDVPLPEWIPTEIIEMRAKL